jgi:phage terminase large subunit-like protein
VGVIPQPAVVRVTPKSGVPDAVESVLVRHVAGGTSELQFRSYDQGREAYQGTAQHVIWLDEEPPESIWTECLLRTMETATHPGGILLATFTPLQGMTPLIMSFLETTHA